MSWQEQAACKGQTRLMFHGPRAEALALCRTCPVLAECSTALKTEVQRHRRHDLEPVDGVWAGRAPKPKQPPKPKRTTQQVHADARVDDRPMCGGCGGPAWFLDDDGRCADCGRVGTLQAPRSLQVAR